MQEPFELIPRSESTRTHESQMNTSTEIDRSEYTKPLRPTSPQERQRGREIAAQQLIEMQKDPEEWASFIKECDLFANGYFSSGE